jgi:hypothetical protein
VAIFYGILSPVIVEIHGEKIIFNREVLTWHDDLAKVHPLALITIAA